MDLFNIINNYIMSGRVLNSSPTYVIDSRNRLSGNTNDFTYIINVKTDHKFDNFCVVQAQIPKSYYLIDSSRSDTTFILQEGLSQAIISIPDGNYNIYSFQPVLTSALNAASPNGYTYSISYPNGQVAAQTNKYTYSVSGNSGVQPSFVFGPGITSRGITNLMGFLPDDITYNFSGNMLISNVTLRFQHTFYLQIKSSSARQPLSQDPDTSVLCTIPVGNTIDSGMIVYDLIELNDASVELTNPGNNIFDFALYDDNDELINLQGQDWSMRVMLYDYNNVSDMQINDLHLKYLEEPIKQIYVENHDPNDGENIISN